MRLGALEGKCRKETDALIRENWGGPMIVPRKTHRHQGHFPDLQRKRTAWLWAISCTGSWEGL